MEKDKETKATEEREGSQVNQNVVDFGSAMTKTAHGTVYTLAIIGQIEGHYLLGDGQKATKYEHLIPLLCAVEESREIIRDVFSAPEVCAILSRESGALLGAVGFQPSSEIFPELSATEQREMGYWLGRPYWGHGVMTEAATELLRFGFETLGLEAVWCSHYDWNSRSRRVIEKCGFRYQFTKETTNVIGMTNKTVFYALKKEEWLAFSGEKEFA